MDRVHKLKCEIAWLKSALESKKRELLEMDRASSWHPARRQRICHEDEDRQMALQLRAQEEADRRLAMRLQAQSRGAWGDGQGAPNARGNSRMWL